MTKEENGTRLAHLRNIVATMPSQPGSYQYYDRNGKIIYVGKAKNLKNRVSSYFHKEVDRFKTKVLVSKIWDITYTVVNTEEDALLLENSLIKKYQPRYNILLKDGKTYPSICVTKEQFPRVFATRNINKKWGQYFGPYSSVSTMHGLLGIIKELYHPRTCRFPITEEGIKAGKYKPCLEYHIRNCEAPCIGKQTREDYTQNIEQAREILKGNTREVQKLLYEKMMQAAEELRFEEAEMMKGKYNLLEKFASKSEVVSHTITNIDVFSLTEDDTRAYINYMHVTNGAINQAFTYEFKKKLDETADDILTLGIMQIREQVGSDAREIVLPFEPETHIPDVTITVPMRGEKKHLLELSEMNCRQYRFDRLKQAEKLNPEQKQTRLMKELQKALGMKKMPYHIECFDNSNISGADAVAGCVVFKGLKTSKKDYRKYNIRTVEGPDDYASMKEVVRRRYARLQEEKQPLPDLIITDGGKGQMEVVRQVIEDEMSLGIAIAGLAKNDRHRYAITFHREKRSKHALHSELDDISGIGPKTKELLIKELKSIKRIKTADLQTLTKIIGSSKGKILYEHFHKQE